MNFFTEPQEEKSTFMLSDILVYEWIGGKHEFVDLTGTFLQGRLRTKNLTDE